MAIKYVIQTEVVDITVDTPKVDDVFFIDTNVWYWMTYTRASLSASPPARYQTTHYPAYANAALAAGSQLYQSGLSLAELSHRIEKAEFEIFAKANPAIFPDQKRFNKRFRHSPERSQVISEIQAAWGLVKSLASPLAVTINEPTTDAALTRLQTAKVDGYDLFILESMKNRGLVQVITDDGDFATVSGIRVFTANRKVITAARNQRKLKTR